MKRYSYHTTSEQINPLSQFDTASSDDTPVGFSVPTNCAWWQLIVRASLAIEIGDPNYGGIYVDNCYYPMILNLENQDVPYLYTVLDFSVDCGINASPQFYITKPVTVGFTVPGDYFGYVNPLFEPISTGTPYGLMNEISVIMRRGYFQEMK